MQVYGRGALRFEERLAVERDYIENVSIGSHGPVDEMGRTQPEPSEVRPPYRIAPSAAVPLS